MNRKPNYKKAVVICHGKSEIHICDYIKNNFRLNIEIISNNKGRNSIQISGLRGFLDKKSYSKISNFIEEFNVEYYKKNSKYSLSKKFKIFIIMDTDDCTEKEKKDYINRNMFKGHWAYDYIEPIYNIENLEDVLEKIGIIDRNNKDKMKRYPNIFPLSRKYVGKESIEIDEFYKKLQRCKESNLDVFIKFCIDVHNKNK